MKTRRSLIAEKIHAEILEAEKRIRPHIRETPVEHSLYLSSLGECEVFLKLENIQFSGSFKLRGATNKILSLGLEEKERGVVTASSGNHGAAFAWAARTFGVKGTIYIPETTTQAKIDALKIYGANFFQYGDDCVKAEMKAQETAKQQGLTFISPYNDMKIIGGQGTVGLELFNQIPRLDTVLVPVGGGGLIAGIAGYLRAHNTSIQIIGCQPEKSAVMFESIKAGRILDIESQPTISDGTAGGIEPGAITYDFCRDFVDDFIIVTENEIISALKFILDKHNILIEGAAALPVASFLTQKKRFKGRSVALVISGCKISLDVLKNIL